MKKTLTPEQKQYRDNHERKIITMFAPIAILIMGIWMLLSPAKPKHSHIEKATVSIMKDIWGPNTGIVLCALGGIYLAYTLIQYIKFRKANAKPQ